METPVAAFGTDMTLKGQAMKLPRKVNAPFIAGQGQGQGAGQGMGTGAGVGGGPGGSAVNNGNVSNNGSRTQIPNSNTRTGITQRKKERSSKKINSDSDDEESEDESGTYSGPSHPRSSSTDDNIAPQRDRDSPGKMKGNYCL